MSDWKPIPEQSRPLVPWEGTDEDRQTVARLLAEGTEIPPELPFLHGGFLDQRQLTLEETQAIARYLAKKYGIALD